MQKKFYTDEQISKIKKQWLRVWIGIYGFLTVMIIILWIIFAYHMIDVETLRNSISKLVGKGLEGFLFGFLPLYYCAYQRPGTRLIGCLILLDLVIIAYDFICFCIALAMIMQGGFTITTSLAAYAVVFGIYSLQLLPNGYVLWVFYRLYQINHFLQQEKK